MSSQSHRDSSHKNRERTACSSGGRESYRQSGPKQDPNSEATQGSPNPTAAAVGWALPPRPSAPTIGWAMPTLLLRPPINLTPAVCHWLRQCLCVPTLAEPVPHMRQSPVGWALPTKTKRTGNPVGNAHPKEHARQSVPEKPRSPWQGRFQTRQRPSFQRGLDDQFE